MKKKYFNINTNFESDTYYIFDNKNTDVYISDTTNVTDEKYLTICCNGDDTSLDVAFYLHGLKNVTLDFQGATIVFHGRIQPVIIDKCENVTVKNVTMEYERSFYTELDITANRGDELWTKPKPKFPCRVENGNFIPYAKEWEDKTLHIEKCHFIQAYDAETGKGEGMILTYIGENIIEPATPPGTPRHIKVRTEGENIILCGRIPEHWDETMSIVIEHEERHKSSIALYHSKDVCIDNYRILNGAGMGVLVICTENITINSLKLFRDGQSHGVVTNSADAIHAVAAKGTISINDSTFEGMIDDAVNVHANFYHTVKGEGNIIYARRNEASHALNAYTNAFGAGDMIAVYNGRTLDEKKRYTILETKITGKWAIEIKVDGETDSLNEEDLIENLSTNPNLFIKNCVFGKANSHLRLQTRGKTVIENCEFELPICFTGDMNYWFESGPAQDVTIENCRFTGKRAIVNICPDVPEDVPVYHKGITLRNNIFETNPALVSRNAENITLTGNKISNGEEFRAEYKETTV